MQILVFRCNVSIYVTHLLRCSEKNHGRFIIDNILYFSLCITEVPRNLNYHNQVNKWQHKLSRMTRNLSLTRQPCSSNIRHSKQLYWNRRIDSLCMKHFTCQFRCLERIKTFTGELSQQLGRDWNKSHQNKVSANSIVKMGKVVGVYIPRWEVLIGIEHLLTNRSRDGHITQKIKIPRAYTAQRPK